MRFEGFIGPSYELRSLSVECQRCINMYPEMDEIGTEKDHGVAALIGTSGKRLLTTVTDTFGTIKEPIRGQYVAQNGVLYVVAGNDLFAIDSNWVAHRKLPQSGALTGSGPVSMADNGVSLFIVDAPDGYYMPLGPAAATQTYYNKSSGTGLDANWQGATQVWCADGYFVFNKPDSFEFYNSDLLSTTINPIGLASRETPDNIIGFIWDKRNLWLMGQKSMEVWYNSGAGVNGTTGNTFQIVQGGFIENGLAAAFSLVQIGNTIMWLGQDPRGNGVIYMANGYQPQRVSNHSVELAIQGYGDLSTAVAWTHQENGHNFYLINFDNADTTWCFDMTTGMWHERAYLNPATGLLERDRGQFHAFAYNTHVVGDYSNGNLYSLDEDYYTDNGDPIMRRRASPHISNDMNRVFGHKFQLDFQPGVGLATGQGSDPQAVLQFSDDGGYTWSNEMWASMGKMGEFLKRAIWRRLGQSRNRVYRVTITDPVEVIMIGAELDASGGTS